MRPAEYKDASPDASRDMQTHARPHRKVRLILEYDGSDFSGWQVQPDQRTVQGEIECALTRLTGQKIRITGAGRTDAGVHARAQVATFPYRGKHDSALFLRGLNACLPPDIRVHDSTFVSAEFDARRSAVRRTYRYRIGRKQRAIGRQYAWIPKGGFQVKPMREAASHLIGYHHWESFAKADPEIPVMDSTVYTAQWLADGEDVVFEITAIRFFRNMVRLIVGTLMEVGRGKRTPEDFRKIREARDLSCAGVRAPACGLCLWHIDYS